MIQVTFKGAAGEVTVLTADNLHVADKVIRSQHEYEMARRSALSEFIPHVSLEKRGELNSEQPLLVPKVVTMKVLGVTENGKPLIYDVPNVEAGDIASMANTQRVSGSHFAAIDIRNRQDENAAKSAAQRPAKNGKPILGFSNH